jgi:hypothetical protein
MIKSLHGGIDMKNYGLALLFLIGTAIGVAGTLYGPDYVRPYLPKAMKPAKSGVDGEVTSKRMEQGRLLVTVKTSDGAILVTFTKKVPEINLLVEKGDTVNLDIKGYKPFMDNPGINRVRKPGQKPAQKMEPMPEQEKQSVKAAPEAAGTMKPEAEKKEPAMAEPEAPEKPAPEEPAPLVNSAM